MEKDKEERGVMAGEVVGDDLPPDDPIIPQVEYCPFTEFIAYVRGSRITAGGEVQITLAVPYEYKYNAMPMTDLRGVMFVVNVARPMMPGEIEELEEKRRKELGEETGSTSTETVEVGAHLTVIQGTDDGRPHPRLQSRQK